MTEALLAASASSFAVLAVQAVSFRFGSTTRGTYERLLDLNFDCHRWLRIIVTGKVDNDVGFLLVAPSVVSCSFGFSLLVTGLHAGQKGMQARSTRVSGFPQFDESPISSSPYEGQTRQSSFSTAA